MTIQADIIRFPAAPKTDDLPYIGDGTWSVVEKPYALWLGGNRKVLVEARYVTDWASIPRLFRSIIPKRGRYSPAALVHDWLYASHHVLHSGKPEEITRKEADKIFLEIMADLGVGWLKRKTMYRAVRLGGWRSWGKEKYRILSEDGETILYRDEWTVKPTPVESITA